MASTPDVPPPDSIPTHTPPELPPSDQPDETPMQDPPGFEEPAPDIYEPGQGGGDEIGPEPQIMQVPIPPD